MEEKTLLLASVVYPLKKDRILLAKKVAKIGMGSWNGYGGGVEENETIEESALRELNEECGMSGNLNDLEKIAVVDFHNTKLDGSVFVCQVHFYTLTNPVGEPQETEEMLSPSWHNIKELPFDNMMLADRYWLPQALNGEKVYAIAHYGPYQKELLQEVIVKPLSELKKTTL